MKIITSCLNFLAKSILVVVNLLFFVLALGILYAGSRLKNGGWLEIFEENHPYFDHLYQWSLIGFTCLAALIAFSGCYGAIFRSRCMLCIYGAFVFLGIAAFILLTAGASLSWIFAKSWNHFHRVDRTAERDVAKHFNQIYCSAEAVFVCTKPSPSYSHWRRVHEEQEAQAEDVKNIFLDKNVSVVIKDVMDRMPGQSLVDICENSLWVLETLHDDKLNAVCKWCEQVSTLRPYHDVVSWVNKQCPPTTSSASFCIEDMYQSELDPEDNVNSKSYPFYRPSEIMDQTPYDECRDVFLQLWIEISKWITIVSTILLLYMTFLFQLACRLMRRRSSFCDREANKGETRPLLH